MLRLDRGDAAWERLRTPDFQKKWRQLFDDCPWGTVHQQDDFVLLWYSVYNENFEPVIVWEMDEHGELSGLFTLARSRATSEIVPAGADQSEYQVWLARPRLSRSFIESALDCLSSLFPGQCLKLQFVPESTPVEVARRWQRQRALRRLRRGLLSTTDTAQIVASLKKSANRSKINRLQRLGTLTFGRVLDPDLGIRTLHEMRAFYDARQLSISGIAPFKVDPNKLRFYEALMRSPHLLHVTEMRLDGELIAAHIGPINGDQVILGMIAHSPFYAQYSVGKLHLLMVGELMNKEGFQAFDLTPGGDYKDRFATAYDGVYALTFFFSRTDAYLYAAKRKAIDALKKFVSTDRIKTAVAAFQHKFRLLRLYEVPTRLLKRIKKRIIEDSELRVYKMAVSAASTARDRVCKRDNLDDLLLYEAAESWRPSRVAFISEALRRLGAGNHVYTRMVEGTLAHWGWLAEREEKCDLEEIGQTLELPPHSATLFDFYTHPKYRGRGFYAQSLREMIADAKQIPGAEWIVITTLADNRASRKVIEKAGFEHWLSLFQRVRFGRIKRW